MYELPVNTFAHVLQRELTLPELDIFQAVVKWLTKNGGDEETQRTLMEHIRFPLIAAQDLVSIVKPTKLVPLEFYLEAIEFHATTCTGTIASPIKFKPRGSQCLFTWIPDQKAAISENGLSIEKKGSSAWNLVVFGSQDFTSGKHFWEILIDTISSDRSGLVIGIAPKDHQSSRFDECMGVGMNGGLYRVAATPQQAQTNISRANRVRVELDFTTNTVNFLINRTVFASGNLLWKAVRPVVFMYYHSDRVTVTFPIK